MSEDIITIIADSDLLESAQKNELIAHAKTQGTGSSFFDKLFLFLKPTFNQNEEELLDSAKEFCTQSTSLSELIRTNSRSLETARDLELEKLDPEDFDARQSVWNKFYQGKHALQEQSLLQLQRINSSVLKTVGGSSF